MSPFAIRMITHSVIAETVAKRRGSPTKQPSPKKSPGPRTATTASLPCSETTVFDLATLNIENCIRRVALREDNLILSVVVNASATVFFGQKNFGIERKLCFAIHRQFAFK